MKNNKPLSIAIIGSPNCGKTTLFNRLTGAQQTTGNWPGVTVSKTTGSFSINKKSFELTDLPGVYSLENSSSSGLDEQIARDYLQNADSQLIINVIDAANLERQLFLTAQLLHMGLPVIVVLNRIDMLEALNIKIDIEALSKELGCPVVPISAYYNQGIGELKNLIEPSLNVQTNIHFDLPKELHDAVHFVQENTDINNNESCWEAFKILLKPHLAPSSVQPLIAKKKQELETFYDEELGLIIADLYFQFAHDATQKSLTHTEKLTRNSTDLIDKWTLHSFWGMPIFLTIMYLVFALSITMGAAFIDFFDQTAQALFVDGPTVILQSLSSPDWLIILLANGIGGGIQVVATFIPVIGSLFILLSILEETGYMQRAAFIMDKSMRKIGLSGQAFIPLVVGLGCNIPAVSASRTLPDPRDRIITIMMTPFMSCSARLTVYVLFATAFFADYATLLVFSLYLIGIAAAILTAFILKKTLLPGEAPVLLMELPIYHKPAVINVLLNAKNRLSSFIRDAGKVIVIIVLLINFFNSLGTDGTFGNENKNNSVLSETAMFVSPIFAPLGVEEENWPATVGLVTGLLAKEVVVGALDTLYQGIDEDHTKPTIEEPAESYDFLGALADAALTIPNNIGSIFTDLDDPIGLAMLDDVNNKEVAAEDLDINPSTIDKMSQYFSGEIAAYAYLLLILLYFPCVATFGAIKQELGWSWALYSGGWSLFLGYSVAVLFYQTMTFSQHPVGSGIWIGAILIIFSLFYLILKQIGKKYQPKPSPTIDATD